MRSIRIIVLATLAMFAGTVVASAATPLPPKGERAPVLPARVLDANGDRVVVRNTSRIVVLNGDIAEVVYALDLGSRVVGTDISATYPAAAVAKQRIGYQRTLSAEAIISLRPTVVIGNTMAGPPAVIQQLRDAGVTVVILHDDDRLSAAWTKIQTVGRALGVPKRAARLAAITKRQIQATQRVLAKATSRPKVAFVYVRGARTQLIGGTGSRGDVMLRAARAVDVGSTIGITGFRPITAEAMVAAAPDVIVVPEAGLESVGGKSGLLRVPGVAQTPAGRNNRILTFDDQLILGLGPRTGRALRDLGYALHPELSRK